MVKNTESLEDFYKYKINDLSYNPGKELGQFNVFRIEDRVQSGITSPAYIRRDFYKIMLFQGTNTFHYGDKSIAVNSSTLLFFNPQVPYTYDQLSADTMGCFCVFKDEFFKGNIRLNLSEISLFAAGAQPVFHLNEKDNKDVQRIFENIIKEFNADYMYKYELIKTYVSELIYLSMKFQPSEQLVHQSDASARITSVFLELLERQFPIESISQRFGFRSPKVLAERLSVHVNHLNRAIKKTTGRTTTEHIFERLIGEAKALLKHTDWNIAEISFVLGFEDQAQFNKFFKKQTKINPSVFRQI